MRSVDFSCTSLHHSRRKTLSTQNQPQARFSSIRKDHPGSRFSPMKWLAVLGIAALPALSSAMPARAQTIAANPVQKALSIGESGDIDEHAIPRVNHPNQTPWINQEMRQVIVDLRNSPHLSTEARREATQKLMAFYQEGCGEMKVIVVPDTDKDSGDLGTLYGEKMRLGDQQKDNGIVLLWVDKKVRANAPGKAGIAVGEGIEQVYPDPTGILREHAVPHFNRAAEAQRKGDLVTAQRERDEAVLETINAVMAKMKVH